MAAVILDSGRLLASGIREALRDGWVKLNVSTEHTFHDSIASALTRCNVAFDREYRASRRDRFDLWIPEGGIVVELKMRPTLERVVDQLQRYASHPTVKELLLVSVILPPGLPSEVSGIPLTTLACWSYSL